MTDDVNVDGADETSDASDGASTTDLQDTMMRAQISLVRAEAARTRAEAKLFAAQTAEIQKRIDG